MGHWTMDLHNSLRKKSNCNVGAKRFLIVFDSENSVVEYKSLLCWFWVFEIQLLVAGNESS